jgi:hypothetical protein
MGSAQPSACRAIYHAFWFADANSSTHLIRFRILLNETEVTIVLVVGSTVTTANIRLLGGKGDDRVLSRNASHSGEHFQS